MEFEKLLEKCDTDEYIWFAKRLSANDTGATGAHQVGIYLSKPTAFALAPKMSSEGGNPDIEIPCDIAPNDCKRVLRLIYYNTGTRDECRLTRWGGQEVLGPEMTGSLLWMAFWLGKETSAQAAQAWFCQTIEEEQAVEFFFGPIEPGQGAMLYPSGKPDILPVFSQTRAKEKTPDSWYSSFPEAAEIVSHVVQLLPPDGIAPDELLIKRRDKEFELFRQIESTYVLPHIDKGFHDVDSFISFANSTLNRRKSRSGRSLELQLDAIFDEEKIPHVHGPTSEGNKKPDFLFPSKEAYDDTSWPISRLRFLGAKTTCKDRWRQVLNEADRIPKKHIVTLQEGVSKNQFDEMKNSGVILVVPLSLHSKYPKEVRSELLSLEQFLLQVRNL